MSYEASVQNLRIGEFVMPGKRWVRVVSTPVPSVRHAPNFPCYDVAVQETTGESYTTSIYSEAVTAKTDGDIPTAWTPAAIWRKARKLRMEAAELINRAERAERVAHLLESN